MPLGERRWPERRGLRAEWEHGRHLSSPLASFPGTLMTSPTWCPQAEDPLHVALLPRRCYDEVVSETREVI